MELLERGPIQVELSRLLHEAGTGHGRLVFLGGEAGIGKSALVRRFGELVAGRARMVVGACDPLTTPRPLGPLLDLRSQLSRRFADLIGQRPDKDALFAGLLAELTEGAEPTVVVFEDAHWADEATLDLLRYLGRRVESVPALVLTTYRSDEVTDRHPLRVVLGDLANVGAVRRLALEPLSPAAVRTLCAGTGLDADRLHRQTGGNPFFVTEAIAAAGEGIPPTVRDAVLGAYGWDEERERQYHATSPAELVPARIVAEYRDRYRAQSADGELSVRIAGRLRHHALQRSLLPVVGDWVLLASAPGGDGIALVEQVLPRRSRLSRKVAGERTAEQVLAANIDTVWLASGLDYPLGLRRIERYLALAWESGALPVVLLTKSDLAEDAGASARSAVASVAIGAAVHVVSSVSGAGLEELEDYLRPGATVALLGPSGVGKSTLINRLAGQELLRTGDVRASDHRGRHTTTHRQLIRLPGGAMIVDTPGMRELQLWEDEGVADTFGDIEELAAACRFGDCRHEHEPGCAVQQAAAEGRLSPERLANFHKLARELAWLDRRRDPRAEAEAERAMRSAMKSLRFHPKYRKGLGES